MDVTLEQMGISPSSAQHSSRDNHTYHNMMINAPKALCIFIPRYIANPKVSQSSPIIKIAFSGDPNNSKQYLTGVRISAIIMGILA